MRHINYALKPATIDNAKPQGKAYPLTDGGGLFVEVLPSGSKVWRFKYHLDGKREKVTIGAYPAIGIKAARDRHEELRALVERGQSPAKVKQTSAAERQLGIDRAVTFKTFASVWIEKKLANRATTYRAQIVRWLDTFVYPEIGDKALGEVLPRHVLPILEKLEGTPTTADRVRVIVQQIYDFAILRLLVDTNPARPLRGAVVVPAKTHHVHLVDKQIGLFWRVLKKQGANLVTVAAAQLLLLTMTRKMELLRAKWSEFDLDAEQWDVPAKRMKLRRVHRVYLSRQAIEILRRLEPLTRLAGEQDVDGDGGYVFPSVYKWRGGVHLGEATLNALFWRLDLDGVKFAPHGLRGTAATHLREKRVARDVVELLLSHAVGDETEAAYSHLQLAEERKKALQFLADEVERLAAGAEVIPLRAA